MTRGLYPLVVWVALAMARPSPALAEEPGEAAAEAGGALLAVEDAYSRVDYETVLLLTDRAIRAGGLARDQLVSMLRYRTLASASLQRTALARRTYERLLALEPEMELAPELAPRLRAPLLAAWAEYEGVARRLDVHARADPARSLIHVELVDAAAMVAEVFLEIRPRGAGPFDRHRERAAADVFVGSPLVARALAPGGSGLDYRLTLRDVHRNVLLREEGMFTAPPRVEAEEATEADARASAPEADATVVAEPSGATPRDERARRRRIAIGVLVGGALAATAIAVPLVRRGRGVEVGLTLRY